MTTWKNGLAVLALVLLLNADLATGGKKTDKVKGVVEALKTIKEGVELLKDINDGLGEMGLSFGSLFNFTKKYSKYLIGLVPYGSQANMVMETTGVTGEEDNTPLLLAEFKKLHQRFDQFEGKVKDLTDHISKVVFNQDYENNIVKILDAVRRAHLRFVEQPNAYNLQGLKAACSSRPGKIDPREAIGWLTHLVTQTQRPPFIMDVIFKEAKFDRKQLHSQVSMVISEIVQLGTFVQLCMGTVDTEPVASDEDKTTAAKEVEAVLTAVSIKLEAMDKKLNETWYVTQLNQDLLKVLRRNQETENKKLASVVVRRLLRKYPWVSFRAVVFDFWDGDGDWPQSGHTKENSANRGMSWANNDAKGVVVTWSSDNDTVDDSQKVKGIDAAFADFEKPGTTLGGLVSALGLEGMCDADAPDVIENLRGMPAVRNLNAKRYYAITLPRGGVAKAGFGSVREDRNLYHFGNDKHSRMSFLCESRVSPTLIGGLPEIKNDPEIRQTDTPGHITKVPPLTFVIVQF